MNSALLDIASKIGFHKSISSGSIFTQNGVCEEDTFRYLLQTEQKRAQRSGHAYYVLLVYRTDDKGMVLRMGSNVANEIFAALARSLRETDYIGWYLESHIAGGVLTVVGPDSAGNVHERVKWQLEEMVRNGAHKNNCSFQIKLCRQDELQGIESFGGRPVVVQ